MEIFWSKFLGECHRDLGVGSTPLMRARPFDWCDLSKCRLGLGLGLGDTTNHCTTHMVPQVSETNCFVLLYSLK